MYSIQEQKYFKHLSLLHSCAHNNPSAHQVGVEYPDYMDFSPVQQTFKFMCWIKYDKTLLTSIKSQQQKIWPSQRSPVSSAAVHKGISSARSWGDAAACVPTSGCLHHAPEAIPEVVSYVCLPNQFR